MQLWLTKAFIALCVEADANRHRVARNLVRASTHQKHNH
jgi:hypothetical protein